MARQRETPANCANCGAVLTGPYCHECGQRAVEPRSPVIGLVQDVLVDTLALDSRLARTLGLLLWSPARLAADYIAGKRVRYTPPFRLFLFTSVLFFLIAFALLPEPGPIGTTIIELEGEAGELVIEPSDGEAGETSDAQAFRDLQWEELDYSGPAWMEPHLQQLLLAGQRLLEDPRLFLSQIRTNIPRFMLLAPALYALTLAILYVYRRKFLLYDHLVVSLYMHAALYSYLIAALLIDAATPAEWLAGAPLLWGMAQPFRVLRRVYGSGAISMVLKGAFSQWVYWVGISLIITAGLSYSLYTS
ncbi:MAG: DUF3667 domain-containing protein [Caulobacterales bacterium]|nr:DUF3667 domain-containing protein [Caulobacterales bacterium]